MRLVMFEYQGYPAAGVELGSGEVVSAQLVLGEAAPNTVAELIAGGAQLLMQLSKAAAESAQEERISPANVRLLAPLGPNELLVCAGANYRAHLQEMGEELPGKAAWFIKNSRSVIGPEDPIVLPAEFPSRVDYEGELCIVIGKHCHGICADDAWDYVAGYTLLNDVSARDAFPGLAAARTPIDGRWAWSDMLLGKQFPSFGPLGPAVVTSDEIDDISTHRLITTVNGTIMQDAEISDLAIGIPQLIEQFSRYFAFHPGDVISTGTPAGVGAGQRPPLYLSDGDQVTVSVDGIGNLSNRVISAHPCDTAR